MQKDPEADETGLGRCGKIILVQDEFLWIALDGPALKKFASGSNVYVVSYGAPAGDKEIMHHANPNSRDNPMMITTNLNPMPSAVRSFTMP